MELGVVPLVRQTLAAHAHSSEAVIQSKEPRSHKSQKQIYIYREREYHLIIEIVHGCDIAITKIASGNNLADPFTKLLTTKVFERHVDEMGMRCNPDWQ